MRFTYLFQYESQRSLFDVFSGPKWGCQCTFVFRNPRRELGAVIRGGEAIGSLGEKRIGRS
jgi:hypothetical protein